MSNNFVQQGSTMSPKEIRDELLWIKDKMYLTHDGISRTLIFLVYQEEPISQDDIIKARKDIDTTAIDLINTLKNRETELSSEYYRILAKHVQQERVDVDKLMMDLETQIALISVRIFKLEQSLEIEKNKGQ